MNWFVRFFVSLRFSVSRNISGLGALGFCVSIIMGLHAASFGFWVLSAFSSMVFVAAFMGPVDKEEDHG